MADSQAKSSPGGDHESGGDQSPRSLNVREQDRFLPIANISRIMKRGLPANGKIAKDSKETMQECVSEFISFITSEASDKCQREKRKTINGDDLLWAMTTLGFEDYIDPLKAYLMRYREMEGDSKGSGKGAESSAKRDGQPSQVAQVMMTLDLLELTCSFTQQHSFPLMCVLCELVLNISFSLPSEQFPQIGHQGSFPQGPYGNSQASHMMVQMPNTE